MTGRSVRGREESGASSARPPKIAKCATIRLLGPLPLLLSAIPVAQVQPGLPQVAAKEEVVGLLTHQLVPQGQGALPGLATQFILIVSAVQDAQVVEASCQIAAVLRPVRIALGQPLLNARSAGPGG